LLVSGFDNSIMQKENIIFNIRGNKSKTEGTPFFCKNSDEIASPPCDLIGSNPFASDPFNEFSRFCHTQQP
jgi:hypothetical protein